MLQRLSAFFSRQKKILAAFGLVFLAFLILDLNHRIEELFRLTAERDSMATEVAQLHQTEQSLQTAIAYGYSDAAAEEWAREEAFMARPGDQPIILVPDPKYTPLPTPVVEPTPLAYQNWQIWGLLFFGNQ